MNKLWAPWRNEYITLKKQKGCIFCLGKKSAGKDRARYILKRGHFVFSMLNKYPYNNAHVMVAPYRHVKSLTLLKEEELLGIMKLVTETIKRIDKKLKPQGYNIGLNSGRIAGAGFAGHAHMHIVPRWAGDTNFMPVISSTKIVSSSLDEMWRLLK